MITWYARNDVPYSGGEKQLSITFPYIKKEHIKVFVNDVETTEYHFLNESQIFLDCELNTGDIMSVRRNTPIDEQMVTFTDTSIVNAEKQNLAQKQVFNTIQEIYDNNQQFNITLQADVDAKVEAVSDAVEKLEFLEDSVEIANEAALVATEQAQIATEKAEEATSTHTQALKDIEEAAALEKEEINKLSEDLKDTVGDIKVLTTLKIGQIGIAPLGIDETLNMERYLNGQLIIQDQFKGFTQFLKRRVELYPSLACLEDEWQTIVANSDFSQCGKFVIDDNAGTIRLPKVVNIQGLTDLSKLGEIVEAGLPNITGSFTTQNDKFYTGTGAFVASGNTTRYTQGISSGGNGANGESFDASLSNPIYNNSDTVQQEQIQYPYFIQVATGAETEENIINEIELNNPFSLLDYKFSEYELNNLSWLRSNGQYNSKAIYPAVYDLLLKIYNGVETKAGVSVKLTSETFTDYDFVLNTAEETFRLPIKVKLASGKAVVGNGQSLVGLQNLTSPSISKPEFYFGKNPSNDDVTIWNSAQTQSAIGITTDPTKSGIETSDSDLYLYFYVGETVQNANLINAGRIEETLAGKVDRSSLVEIPVIVETYVNGHSWYRVWSDGFKEQAGYQASGGTFADVTVTFLKPFSDANYTFIRNIKRNPAKSDGAVGGWTGYTSKTATSVTFINEASSYGLGSAWYACGY